MGGCCGPPSPTAGAGDCCPKTQEPCATFYVPLLPCPPDICPVRSCPAEDPCEQCLQYDTGCQSWWCDKKPDRNIYHHKECWCNGWNLGDGYGRPACALPPGPWPPRRPKCTDQLPRFQKFSQRRIFEKQLRDKMFPPPPANICSFKPCVMEMIPPTWCSPTWSGRPQKCAKEPMSSFYVPGPCRRPGCLHLSDLKPSDCCKWDCGPCKADCFEAKACTRKRCYPRGYPH